VRLTYGCAGLGGWEKRKHYCNDSDTSLNVTRHESEQTPSWSFIARKFGESRNEGKQMTAMETLAGAPLACDENIYRLYVDCKCILQRLSEILIAGSFNWL